MCTDTRQASPCVGKACEEDVAVRRGRMVRRGARPARALPTCGTCAAPAFNCVGLAAVALLTLTDRLRAEAAEHTYVGVNSATARCTIFCALSLSAPLGCYLSMSRHLTTYLCPKQQCVARNRKLRVAQSEQSVLSARLHSCSGAATLLTRMYAQ